MQHIFKKFLVTGAMALALSACVSTKKFDLQTSELNDTQKKLNDAVIAQQNLQLDLKKLKDSIQTARKNDRQNEIDDVYSLYRTAVKTADYPQASASLQKLLLLDSSQAYWAYDSLAIYHYMYLIVPGSTKRSPAAQYFVDKGLSINPKNDYLMEMKGKLLIEGGNDTAAYRIFNNLWNKTGDFTYLWNMT
ncbi:MAG: hypothetical protein IT244_00505, partial [Bacteroidia bacterium]|nr:hypothetical protein [Bacteroidia bacterium]